MKRQDLPAKAHVAAEEAKDALGRANVLVPMFPYIYFLMFLSRIYLFLYFSGRPIPHSVITSSFHVFMSYRLILPFHIAWLPNAPFLYFRISPCLHLVNQFHRRTVSLEKCVYCNMSMLVNMISSLSNVLQLLFHRNVVWFEQRLLANANIADYTLYVGWWSSEQFLFCEIWIIRFEAYVCDTI